ncbi:GNAT domain-containing protein [Mycena galericulata]|nr:GNAT domain-containing protein [Mycena galericulata]
MQPLELNAATGEPFLRLPAPFSNIIITPPRMSDVEPSVAILSDPAVSLWMGPMGPTGTYTASQAEGWLTKLKAETDGILDEMGRNSGPFSECPVRHIREVQEDGTEVFIGDVGIYRSSWSDVLDREERARLVAENNARVAGDPDIVWHVGYYLSPTHHKRGLMTTAVKAMIQWGIAWMGVKYIRTSAFEGNYGSLKLLQKNEFVVVDTLVDHVAMGDKKLTLHVVERRI